jgi:hypothetical protein
MQGAPTILWAVPRPPYYGKGLPAGGAEGMFVIVGWEGDEWFARASVR